MRVGISQAFAEEGGSRSPLPRSRTSSRDRRGDRRLAVRDVLPRELRPGAVPGPPLPRPRRGRRAGAASGLVGRRRAPLVYMTFGSVAAAFPPRPPRIARRWRRSPGSRCASCSPSAASSSWARCRENVHVEQWVPQADVLAHAALVVCHGGSGTTLGALAAGRPLVVVPLFADQPFNAARAGIVGAGVAALDDVRPRLERVLADERYRSAASGSRTRCAACRRSTPSWPRGSARARLKLAGPAASRATAPRAARAGRARRARRGPGATSCSARRAPSGSARAGPARSSRRGRSPRRARSRTPAGRRSSRRRTP